MISRHFSEAEARCKCGCNKLMIQPALVGLLEAIRARYGGKPVIVHSWNRCEKHNAAVGGEKGSYHMRGLAADIHIGGVPRDPHNLDILAKTAVELGADGVGMYYRDGFVHVDMRTWGGGTGGARWVG